MIALIGLPEAKTHLNIAGTDQDYDIEIKILEASAIVLDYVKVALPEPASPPDPDEAIIAAIYSQFKYPDLAARLIPHCVKLALSEMNENREAGATDILSPAVKALLHRLRDPAMA